MIELLILAAAAKAAVPTVEGTFDCQSDMPAIIAANDGKVQLQAMGGISPDNLRFAMTLKGDKALVGWDKSPVNVSGKAKVIATGTDAGMALFESNGPCTFTEKSCATMLHYAKQADGSLKLLISPTALITDQAKTTRSPFLVIVSGRCTARKEG